jgi:hypothetical protein
MSGYEFNITYSNYKFYKTCNEKLSEKHHNFTKNYNENEIIHNDNFKYISGGFVFSNNKKIYKYLNKCVFIIEITIPENALIYIEYNKNTHCNIWKTNKFNRYLQNIKLIEDFNEWSNYEFCLNAIYYDSEYLKYIVKQTEELCCIAVSKDGLTLRYVINQTYKICREAVMNDGSAIYWVENKTPEICMLAVKNNGYALVNIPYDCQEIALEAVKQNYMVFEYVKKQTPEICIEVLNKNGLLIREVKNITMELCIIAIKQNSKALQYIPDNMKTFDLCLIAVKQDSNVLQFVPKNKQKKLKKILKI